MPDKTPKVHLSPPEQLDHSLVHHVNMETWLAIELAKAHRRS